MQRLLTKLLQVGSGGKPFELVDPDSLRVWWAPQSLVGDPVITEWRNLSQSEAFPPSQGDLTIGQATRVTSVENNGIPVASFNGTTETLATVAVLAAGTPQPIVYTIVYRQTLEDTKPNAGIVSGANVPETMADQRNFGRLVGLQNPAPFFGSSNNTVSPNQWTCHTAIFDGATSITRLGRLDRQEGNGGSAGVVPAVSTQLRVGARDGPIDFYEGEIAEVIIWAPDAADIDADVLSVEAYLYGRYIALLDSTIETPMGRWHPPSIVDQTNGTTSWFVTPPTQRSGSLQVALGTFDSVADSHFELGVYGQDRLSTPVQSFFWTSINGGTFYGVLNNLTGNTNSGTPSANSMFFGIEVGAEMNVRNNGELSWNFFGGGTQTVLTTTPPGSFYFVAGWDAINARSFLRINGVEIGTTTNFLLSNNSPGLSVGDGPTSALGDAIAYGSFRVRLLPERLAELEAELATLAEVDLSMALTAAPEPAEPLGALTYTATVTNLEPRKSAGNVEVEVTLPAGAVFVSATGTDWVCNEAGGVVTCTRTTADPGASPDITIDITLPLAAGNIQATAVVSADQQDPDTGNNTDTADTSVEFTSTFLLQYNPDTWCRAEDNPGSEPNAWSNIGAASDYNIVGPGTFTTNAVGTFTAYTGDIASPGDLDASTGLVWVVGIVVDPAGAAAGWFTDSLLSVYARTVNDEAQTRHYMGSGFTQSPTTNWWFSGTYYSLVTLNDNPATNGVWYRDGVNDWQVGASITEWPNDWTGLANGSNWVEFFVAGFASTAAADACVAGIHAFWEDKFPSLGW